MVPDQSAALSKVTHLRIGLPGHICLALSKDSIAPVCPLLHRLLLYHRAESAMTAITVNALYRQSSATISARMTSTAVA